MEGAEVLLQIHVPDPARFCSKSVGTDLTMLDITELHTEVLALRELVTALEIKLSQRTQEVVVTSSSHRPEPVFTCKSEEKRTALKPEHADMCVSELNSSTQSMGPERRGPDLHEDDGGEDTDTSSVSPICAAEPDCLDEVGVQQQQLQVVVVQEDEDEDVPPLTLHCYNEAPGPPTHPPNRGRRSLRTPLKVCSVRLLDCSRVQETGGNAAAPEEMSEGTCDEEEQQDDDDEYIPCVDTDDADDGDVDFTPLSTGGGLKHCAKRTKCKPRKQTQQETSCVCAECGKTLRTLKSLRQHERRHAGIARPYACTLCQKAFVSPALLKTHFRTHTGEKPFRCEDCGRCFALKGTLKSHQNIHNQQGQYQCSYCDRRFGNSSHLNRHERRHKREKPHRCEDCNKTFYSGTELKSHQRIHTGERPYSCSHCGTSFAQRGHLVCHERMHTGEKPYLCDLCGKAYSDPTHFATHKRTHTGIRPYECTYCGKCYLHRIDLRQHQRSHTNERPYQCPQCHKAFARADVLKTHLRVHTGEKPYHCVLCGQRFVYLSGYHAHKKKHAGEEGNPAVEGSTERAAEAPLPTDQEGAGSDPASSTAAVVSLSS